MNRFLHLASFHLEDCSACNVVHRTRRTATAESKVYDADGKLVAMGTAAFRVFDKKGSAIV